MEAGRSQSLGEAAPCRPAGRRVFKPPLNQRRVLRVLWPRSRCEAWEVRNARIDEHIAHKECRLDGVVGEVTSCGVHRVRVGVRRDGVVVGVRTCHQGRRIGSNDGCNDGLGFGRGPRISCHTSVVMGVARRLVVSCRLRGSGDSVIMRRHLGNRQLMGLFTDVLAWRMEGGRDGVGSLSDDTHHTTSGVGEIEGGACATELVTDDLEEKIVLSGGERTSVALYPTNVIVSHE